MMSGSAGSANILKNQTRARGHSGYIPGAVYNGWTETTEWRSFDGLVIGAQASTQPHETYPSNT